MTFGAIFSPTYSSLLLWRLLIYLWRSRGGRGVGIDTALYRSLCLALLTRCMSSLPLTLTFVLKWSVLTPNVLAASSSTWPALLGRCPSLFRTLNLIAMALQLILASFGNDVKKILSLLCHICKFHVFQLVFFFSCLILFL